MHIQKLLVRGWWPRQYYEPLECWRPRKWNSLADMLCNVAMDSRRDFYWKSHEHQEWKLRPGVVLQYHSDGGFREPGCAAAACTLTVLEVDRHGELCRTLLRAAATFINDPLMTPPAAERLARTMSVSEASCFTQRMDAKASNSS